MLARRREERTQPVTAAALVAAPDPTQEIHAEVVAVVVV
jgi:hypothetical protein